MGNGIILECTLCAQAVAGRFIKKIAIYVFFLRAGKLVNPVARLIFSSDGMDSGVYLQQRGGDAACLGVD